MNPSVLLRPAPRLLAPSASQPNPGLGPAPPAPLRYMRQLWSLELLPHFASHVRKGSMPNLLSNGPPARQTAPPLQRSSTPTRLGPTRLGPTRLDPTRLDSTRLHSTQHAPLQDGLPLGEGV